ncbi:Tyrosine-protein phosphatase non-receptor type 9, partial [Armadillidium vulgare]
PSESGVEETERNLNEKDSTDDFKSSCVDSSEALFEGYISELSEDDESIGKALSYEDLGDDLEESPSDAEADCPLEQRGVPIELSTAEEEKIEGSENQSQLRNIINEVQQEAARVNGHSKDNSLNVIVVIIISQSKRTHEAVKCKCSSHLKYQFSKFYLFLREMQDLFNRFVLIRRDDSLLSSEISDSDTLHSDNEQGYTLKEFVKYLKETGRAGLHYEYSQIKGKPPFGTFHHSRQRWNQLKNRYIDVLCYDHSRVELAAEDEEGHTTYINGNFVDGYKQKNAFISTQGPLPCTFGDFWRMVWEQQVCVIVMTTKTLERGRTKCGQYWPAEQGSSVTHTHFSITNTSVTSETNYIITQLSILDSRVSIPNIINKYSNIIMKTGEERVVEHLQFTSWPDYGVPDSALAMLGFLAKVRESQSKLTASLGKKWDGHPLGPPILVHCSAGIGRTGTFCTLDICIRRLEDVGLIDVRGTVERIRNQRAFSIQMPEQYVFCHLALLEYAISSGKLQEVDLTGFENQSSDSD